MHTSTLLTTLALLSTALSAPTLTSRAASTACFIIGSTTLPAEVQDTVTAIQSSITCSNTKTTISSVPDVSSGGTTFSSIDFSQSSQTPLAFALSEFATSTPLASTNLTLFQDRLNTYLATEAGLRSISGSLAIKAPKFFLSYQISRIKTAQGITITDPGQTVEHLLGKVIKNAGSKESQATKDAITALSTVLA